MVQRESEVRIADFDQKREDAIKAIRYSHKGRKCKVRSCKHKLSIYNHEEFCHIHLVSNMQDRKYSAAKQKN